MQLLYDFNFFLIYFQAYPWNYVLQNNSLFYHEMTLLPIHNKIDFFISSKHHIQIIQAFLEWFTKIEKSFMNTSIEHSIKYENISTMQR